MRDSLSIRRGSEPAWLKPCLIALGLFLTFFLLLVPLGTVFYEAFKLGGRVFWANVIQKDMLRAFGLTLFTALLTVPVNIVFGVMAAWCVTKFQFPGKKLLVSLIDLPFSISPIVAGVIYLMLYGMRGWFGPWLDEHNIKLMFAVPGIVMVTIFVTCPFVARELIPLMQVQGTEDEEAALVLGANGWQTFYRVTLPNIRWALIYGAILCNARAIGEFGAVSVVSGHIQGETNTLPLQVELLYHGYDAASVAGAFVAAVLLICLALLTLVAKALTQQRVKEVSAASQAAISKADQAF